MRKALVLTLVLSLCIGLGTTLVASLDTVRTDSAVAWINWTPGTPPTSNAATIDKGIAWINWTPGTPPTSNVVTIGKGIAWIDWTPGTPPTRDVPTRI